MSDKLVKVTVWLARILVGGTFILSGITKGIDPWGTFYKISAYFDVWHLSIGEGIPLFCADALSAVEFLAGVMLLTGCYRRVAAWTAGAIMAFMLPLSLWIAVTDPVSDCGCFGDAIHLSNWGTFFKNVVLSAGVILLLMRNTKGITLVSRHLQWIGFVATLAFILAIEWIGYWRQPLIDYRPYRVGNYLFHTDSDDNADDDDFIFIYEKDGERREFTLDSTLPEEDSGWTFVDRIVKSKSNLPDTQKASVAGTLSESALRLWDELGEEDLTESNAPMGGEAIVAVIPELHSLSVATSWKLNELYSLALKEGGEMIAVTSATPDEIEAWRDLSLAEYPIFTCEDTVLKEVVRGNPGIVYTDDGKIIWKTALTAIDSHSLEGEENRLDEKLHNQHSFPKTKLSSLGNDDSLLGKSLVALYLSVMALLMTASWLLNLRQVKRRSRSY